jgi:hypothetical protein
LEGGMKAVLRRQIDELIAIHKGLSKIVENNDGIVVSGLLRFEASAEGLEIVAETFEIELIIPRDFPSSLPQVCEKENVGRIAADYHHLNSDGTFCLALPIEQRRIFLEDSTLLGFVNRLVVPYLYGSVRM